MLCCCSLAFALVLVLPLAPALAFLVLVLVAFLYCSFVPTLSLVLIFVLSLLLLLLFSRYYSCSALVLVLILILICSAWFFPISWFSLTFFLLILPSLLLLWFSCSSSCCCSFSCSFFLLLLSMFCFSLRRFRSTLAFILYIFHLYLSWLCLGLCPDFVHLSACFSRCPVVFVLKHLVLLLALFFEHFNLVPMTSVLSLVQTFVFFTKLLLLLQRLQLYSISYGSHPSFNSSYSIFHLFFFSSRCFPTWIPLLKVPCTPRKQVLWNIWSAPPSLEKELVQFLNKLYASATWNLCSSRGSTQHLWDPGPRCSTAQPEPTTCSQLKLSLELWISTPETKMVSHPLKSLSSWTTSK